MKETKLHPLVSIARRRQRPGSGSVLAEPSHPYYAMNFRAMFSVPFAIVGGQATRAYMPARATLDWDVMVHLEDLDQARLDLEETGAHTFVALTIAGFSCGLPSGEPLDVIGSDAEWVSQALARPNHDSSGQPVLGLSYLVLMKLESSRVQDLADVSRMLACANQERVEEARKTVRSYLPSAREDFESLLALGRLERGREA